MPSHIILPRLRLQSLTWRPGFRPPVLLASDGPEHDECVEDAESKSPPQAGTDKSQPCEMDEGRAEQRDEEPVSPRRLETQNAYARISAGPRIFPNCHQGEQGEYGQEEDGGRKGPCHPSARHERSEPVAFAVLHRQGHRQGEGRDRIDGEDGCESVRPAAIPTGCCRHQTLPRAKPLAM